MPEKSKQKWRAGKVKEYKDSSVIGQSGQKVQMSKLWLKTKQNTLNIFVVAAGGLVVIKLLPNACGFLSFF